MLQTGIDYADLISSYSAQKLHIPQNNILSRFMISILLGIDLIIPIIRINSHMNFEKWNHVGNPLHCHSNSVLTHSIRDINLFKIRLFILMYVSRKEVLCKNIAGRLGKTFLSHSKFKNICPWIQQGMVML